MLPRPSGERLPLDALTISPVDQKRVLLTGYAWGCLPEMSRRPAKISISEPTIIHPRRRRVVQAPLIEPHSAFGARQEADSAKKWGQFSRARVGQFPRAR